MRFSIIIPVYNAEKYLPNCLESIVKQSFADYEVLLVNDGSTDSSEQICSRYCELSPNFRYFCQENSGPSSARNAGILRACGEYLLFLDADDALDGNALARLDQILSCQGPDAVLSPLKYYYPETNSYTLENAMVDSKRFSENREAAFREMAAKRFAVPALKAVIRREIVVKKDILFPVRFMIGEDIHMVARALCECQTICFHPEAYYLYTQNAASIMHTVNYERISKTMEICQELFAFAANRPEAEKGFLHTQISMMLINFLQYFQKFTAEQRSETIQWLKKNRALLDPVSDTHSATKLAKKFIGPKNAFLLAGAVAALQNR